jgi:hypothetical protein
MAMQATPVRRERQRVASRAEIRMGFSTAG